MRRNAPAPAEGSLSPARLADVAGVGVDVALDRDVRPLCALHALGSGAAHAAYRRFGRVLAMYSGMDLPSRPDAPDHEMIENNDTAIVYEYLRSLGGPGNESWRPGRGGTARYAKPIRSHTRSGEDDG